MPYPPAVKLFEMPVLGYLGFLPFALECFAMYHFGSGVLQHGSERGWPDKGARVLQHPPSAATPLI